MEQVKKEKTASPTVLRKSTRGLTPKAAVNSLVSAAASAEEEIKLLDDLKQEEKKDNEFAADYLIHNMLKKTVDKVVTDASPSRRLTRKLQPPRTEAEKELDHIVMQDSRNRMKYFQGLTRELLKANRLQFYRHLDGKTPLTEKYADHIAKEHEVIKRHEKALDESGYYVNKYFVSSTTADATSSSSAASLKEANLLSTLFTGPSGGVNILAVIIASLAVLSLVIMIIAIIAASGKKKKTNKLPKGEDYNESDTDTHTKSKADEYEKF